MRSRALGGWGRGGLALVACVTLLAASGRGQGDALGGRSRAIVSDTGLAGIDRGLRERDLPLHPGGRSTRGLATVERADSAVVDRLMLNGSVIVKFRDGAGQNGKASAMQELEASGIKRPSYADFDIMDIDADADPEAVSSALRTRPDVEYAQPRYRNYAMLQPNDTFYGRQ